MAAVGWAELHQGGDEHVDLGVLAGLAVEDEAGRRRGCRADHAQREVEPGGQVLEGRRVGQRRCSASIGESLICRSLGPSGPSGRRLLDGRGALARTRPAR